MGEPTTTRDNRKPPAAWPVELREMAEYYRLLGWAVAHGQQRIAEALQATIRRKQARARQGVQA